MIRLLADQGEGGPEAQPPQEPEEDDGGREEALQSAVMMWNA